MRELPQFSRSLEEAEPARIAAFESCFAPAGRFRRADSQVEWLRLRYWYYTGVLRDMELYRPYLTNFHFDFLADAALNAVAALENRVYLIGVNVGSVYNTQTLFTTLLSHPAVLPGVGDPTREVASRGVQCQTRPDRVAVAAPAPQRNANPRVLAGIGVMKQQR